MNHKHTKEKKCKIKIVTVSDTRTLKNDSSGDTIEKILEKENHEIERKIVKDNKKEILNQISKKEDIIIYCGGTGISKKDVTVEAIKPILDKNIPGFAEYFRAKSFEEVGSRAILTRATAGLIDDTIIFAIPGSKNAAETATKIIKKELNHLIYHRQEK